MGAPGAGMQAAEETSAEALLSAFKTIDPAERRKHASVLNYWLSIRGDKEFPPLHDLDPLEISDAGPHSVLLELISGGHDAEVRHIGEALRDEGRPERIIDAATPSVLASIAKKLPIVAISRDFLAFEDEFRTLERSTRCWVTLLPLSAGGAWVDYVYGLVSIETESAEAAEAAKPPAKTRARSPVEEEVQEQAAEPEPVLSETEEPAEAVIPDAQAEEPAEALVEEPQADEPTEEMPLDEPVVQEPVAEVAPNEEIAEAAEDAPEALDELGDEAPADEPAGKGRPGFSKLLDNLAGLTGFYGHGYKVDPEISASAAEQPEDSTDEPVADAAPAPEAEPFAEVIAAAAPDEAPAADPEELAETAVTDEAVTQPPAEEAPIEPSADQPAPAMEGLLQTKLADVRAKADEARQAKLRANAALYEGLSAAYDFALDAEEAPEEYLRLVEGAGLKIQLRAPMRPVVKLAFNGLCDDATIGQLEAVLAWALDNELPRGSLIERIEAAGGIAPILQGEAKAA